MDAKRKGQGGFEYVILFTFTVVFFAIVVYVANEQLAIVNKQQRLEQAKLALKQIADAATEAYQQGAGARVVRTITFPNGVSGSGEIINNTIRIVFEGTDIIYPLNFPITGTIPNSPGSYEIVFTSYGGSVSVGISTFSLSKYLLTFNLCSQSYSQTVNDTIQIINNNLYPINVSSSVNFISSSISITLSSYSSYIPAQQVSNINISSVIAADTIGLFTGYLLFNTSNYSILVPIAFNIEACGQNLNVSYINVDTYKDPAYSIPYTNFSMYPLVQITTTGWLPLSYITLDLKNGTVSMPGYPKLVQTDSNGVYTEYWNSTGMPGNYIVSANYSIYNVNYSFTVEPC